jgi:metal-responsive CopG/Arc/MetJ family transcriptional regulator
MRFLAELPDDEVAELDALARRNGRSRAAEVREAVRLYLRSRTGKDWIARGAGYWRDRDGADAARTGEGAGRRDGAPG